MDFRLVYEGPLPGQNARAPAKQAIREALHPQLERLWSQPPLSEMRSFLDFPAKPGGVSVIVERGQKKYAPLVTKALDLYAELDVLMFRPQPRGDLITDGGDVDNRLKTLLDALRIPRNPSETGHGVGTSGGIFFCLLQDDSLVTRVSVETEQWLHAKDPDSVLAIVRVTIKKTRTSYANLAF